MDIYSKDNIACILAMSPMQEGMLFHSLLNPGSTAYLQQMSVVLKGMLNEEYVRESFEELLRRHQVLRTVFTGGRTERPLQIVLKTYPLCFRYEDLSGENNPECRAGQLKKEESGRPVDLARGPVLRMVLIKKGEKAFELLWIFHHILLDGWSLGLLVNEFVQLYRGKFGQLCCLPEPAPFNRFIDWVEAQDQEKSRQYWQTYLAGFTRLTGIPGGNGAGGESFRREHVDLVLSQRETKQLQALAARCQVSLYHLMLALWGIMLSKVNRKKDVVFGSVVLGRPGQVRGIESMVGLLINTIPVRVKYDEETRVTQLLETLRQDYFESEPHAYLPLPDVQATSPLRQRLFDHLFVFENIPFQDDNAGEAPEDEVAGTFAVQSIEVLEHTHYHFEVAVYPQPELLIRFIFNGNAVSERLVGRLKQNMLLLVEHVLEAPTGKVADLKLHSEYARLPAPVPLEDF